MPRVRMLCMPLPRHSENPEPFEPFDVRYASAIKAFKPGKYFPVPAGLAKASTRAKALMGSADLMKEFGLDVTADGFRLEKKTTLGQFAMSFPAQHECAPYSGWLRHDKLELFMPHMTEMTFSQGGAVFFKGPGVRAFIAVPRYEPKQ